MTLWFVAALAVVVLLYSAAACFFLLRDLRTQLVRYAIQDVETVEGLLYFTPDGRLTLRDDYHNHPESKHVLERLVEVRSPEGQVLLRNELLGDVHWETRFCQTRGKADTPSARFVLADGLHVQLVSRRHAIDGRPTIIRVAYSEAPLWNQFRADLIASDSPVAAGSLIRRDWRVRSCIAIAAARFSSWRARPKRSKATGFMSVCRSTPADGELADLARVFNAMLVRLEQSFEQLRRFTSDASHELRTPLAAMRSVGEVGLQKNCAPEGYRDVIGSMLEEANKLTRLVDSLLYDRPGRCGTDSVDADRFPGE